MITVYEPSAMVGMEYSWDKYQLVNLFVPVVWNFPFEYGESLIREDGTFKLSGIHTAESDADLPDVVGKFVLARKGSDLLTLEVFRASVLEGYVEAFGAFVNFTPSAIKTRSRNTYAEGVDVDGYVYFCTGEEDVDPFQFNGIGLIDPISCKVKQQLNGEYELTMQYPADGAFFNQLKQRTILKTTAAPEGQEQLFRIYRITKPLNGIVTVYARHIAYDLMGYVARPFTAPDVGSAFIELKNNLTPDVCPFDFFTDKTTAARISVKAPMAAWDCLGGKEGGILDTYRGEYEFDRFTVNLWNRRGTDRGVKIRYGVNMTNLEQDENCATCFTGVVPFWSSEETTVTGSTVNAPGSFDYVRLMPLDLSEKFEDQPSAADMETAATNYIASHQIGVPTVSWKVEFTMLSQTEEYKDIAFLEKILLGDTVAVEFEKMGVNASARVNEVVWDAVMNRYDSVSLGSVKSNIASTIAENIREIAEKPSISLTERIVQSLTDGILGAHGGAVRLLDTNNDGQPDELYVADNADPTLAQNVWRWNYAGLAASKDGYDGPYTMGMTIDDGIMSWLVTAANIVAGSISGDGGNFYADLDSGILTIRGQVQYTAADYTSADATRANKIVVGAITPTAEDVAKYDLNGDGAITITDVVNVQRFAEGQHSSLVIDWVVELSPDTAMTVTKTVTLDGTSYSPRVILSTGAGAVTATSVSAAVGQFGGVLTPSIKGANTSGSVTWTIDADGKASVTSLTVDGVAIGRKIIGYIVTCSGSSGTPVANFYPVGFNGTYMISSDDWFCKFSLNTTTGSAQKSSGTSGTKVDACTAVYNF